MFVKSFLTGASAFRRLGRAYHKDSGRRAHLFQPGTVTERTIHRLVFDRDPRLKLVSDKLIVKDLVAKAVGPKYAVPSLGRWKRMEDVPWDSLPASFVLKPNHTSGRFAIVEDRAAVDRAALTEQANRWMREPRRTDIKVEWGYQDVDRFLMIEPLLRGIDGGTPDELSVFTIGGKALLFRRFFGRKTTPARRDAWFDADGRQLEIATRLRSIVASFDAATLKLTAELSEQLGRGFSSLRVDFYLLPDQVLIGELTPYGWGGKYVFRRPEYDKKFGRLWQDPDTSIFADFDPAIAEPLSPAGVHPTRESAADG